MISDDARTPWWSTFYDEHLADMLLDSADEGETARTAEFLRGALELRGGERLLDQCCGSGRLTWEMHRRGFEMLGMDLIPGYIERARNRSASPPGEGAPSFVVADAFDFVARPACDAAFNWWTSFGYSEDDETNLLMLRRAFESLRPGGRFALDFMNVPGLCRHFLPFDVKRKDGVVLVRESELDLTANIIRKRWTYFLPEGRRVEHASSVRLYDSAALRRLFETVGFAEVVFFGDTDASPLGLESPRCIVVARRPQ